MDERVDPGVTDVWNVRRHIARYNLALGMCQDKHVLDLACGTGYGTELISTVSNSVVGIDIDVNSILDAQLKYCDEYGLDNIEFDCFDAVDYLKEFDPRIFETVVCFETIEHLDSYIEFCNNLHNKVLSGGHIIYSVPLDETPGWNPHHKQVFSLEQARNIFNHKFVDEFIQVGLNFYRIGEILPDGKQTYIGIRQV